MSTSETITKADLKNILDDVLPSANQASDTTPIKDGTASAGTENNWARGDHVHPTDTTRQASLDVTTIARGYVSGSSVASNSYTDFSLSFGKTFPANPYVVVAFLSESTAGAFGRCTIAVHSITTTGCKVRVFNGDTVARSPGFEWIAIY